MSSDTRKKLEALWFRFGNGGPKHTQGKIRRR
jgi:hypothetical protein